MLTSIARPSAYKIFLPPLANIKIIVGLGTGLTATSTAAEVEATKSDGFNSSTDVFTTYTNFDSVGRVVYTLNTNITVVCSYAALCFMSGQTVVRLISFKNITTGSIPPGSSMQFTIQATI